MDRLHRIIWRLLNDPTLDVEKEIADLTPQEQHAIRYSFRPDKREYVHANYWTMWFEHQEQGPA